MAVDTETKQLAEAGDPADAVAPIEGGLELSWMTRRQTRLKIPKPRVLEIDTAASDLTDEDPGNLVIEGDNRQAMVSLLPQYAGRVDVVLIDPPYNTGKNDFRYNDARFHDPDSDIRASEFVSAEDGGRHRKWLRQMAPTLRLIKDLMAPAGVIFCHINDIELGRLLLLMEDIFDEPNRVGVLVWKNATDNNPSRIVTEHEYIVCFAKDISKLPKQWVSPEAETRDRLLLEFAALKENLGDDEAALAKAWRKLVKDNKEALADLDRYTNVDEHGPYRVGYRVHNPKPGGYRYDIPHPVTGEPTKQPLHGYRYPEDSMKKLIDEGSIIFGADHTTIVQMKERLENYDLSMKSVVEIDGRTGAKTLRALLGEEGEKFRNPKPVEIEEWVLSFVANPDALVLDCFAGSGTTAHAVMRLNKNDAGTRRYILVEEGEEGDRYALTLTAERLRQARLKEELPGGFSFYRVGPKIDLDAFEQLQREQLITTILQTDASGRGGGIKRVDGSKWVIGRNAKREAICLHFDAKDHSPVTADMLREMYAEAAELGLQRPLRVYSERSEIFGSDSFRFFKLPDEVTNNLSIALKGF